MKKNVTIALILFIIGSVLLINVGSFGVVETSDARYAEIAREMYVSNDYINPNLLDVHHYHKPPFTYQITALGYKLFGVNSFGARFFLQLSVLLQILLVYKLSLIFFSKKNTAIYSAIIYASFPLVLVSSRNLTTDSFLTTFALLSIYSWLKYIKSNKNTYIYIFAISLGLGFYTKGPVIFIAPLTFVLAYKKFNKITYHFSIHHLIAFILFMIIGFWWYLLLINNNSDFLNYFLGKQTIERFSKNAFDRSEPFWYFLLLTPVVGAPWVLILPYLLKVNKKYFNKNNMIKILVISVSIPMIFLSISSSKRILYILPLYVFLALLASYMFDFINEKQRKVVSISVFSFYAIILVAIIVIPYTNTNFFVPNSVIIISASTLLILSYLLLSKKFNSEQKPMLTSFIMSIFLIFISSHLMAVNQLKINSTKPIVDFLKSEKLDNKEVIIYNSRRPSIAFELNKSIVSIYNNSNDLNRETQFEQDQNWRKFLLNINNDDDKKEILNIVKNQPTVLISYKESSNDLNIKSLTKYYTNKKKLGKYIIYY